MSRRSATPSLSAPIKVPTAEGLCWVKDLLWIYDFGSILGCRHGDHLTQRRVLICSGQKSSCTQGEYGKGNEARNISCVSLTNRTSVFHAD